MLVLVVDAVELGVVVAVAVGVLVMVVLRVVDAVDVIVVVTLVVGVVMTQSAKVPSTYELMARLNTATVALHRTRLSLRNPPTEQVTEVSCGSAGLA